MSELCRLWHVTVTVAGDDVEPLIVRNALRRLSDQRPFLHSLKYAGGRAEIQYWEEAETPPRRLVARAAGLERAPRVGRPAPVGGRRPRGARAPVFLSRGMEYNVIVDLHDVTPLPF